MSCCVHSRARFQSVYTWLAQRTLSRETVRVGSVVAHRGLKCSRGAVSVHRIRPSRAVIPKNGRQMPTPRDNPVHIWRPHVHPAGLGTDTVNTINYNFVLIILELGNL